MVDAVQRIMDLMVPELTDLQKLEIFSKEEIQQIIKRREGFEYMLHRRAKIKTDFLRCIMYEIHLDALRKKRKARLGLKKTTECDHAWNRRIHFLFERACRFFKGDVTMWIQYIQFNIKTKNEKKLGSIFPQALQIHPRNTGLWIMAASWEFESNNNAVAARNLLQRAIRINKHDKKLWMEYFRMEMLYVAKLVTRRNILGLDKSKKKSNQSASISIPSLEVENDSDGGSSDDGTDNNNNTKEFLQGLIPKIVFKKAFSEFPEDLDIRTSFLSICDKLKDFPFSHVVASDIEASVQSELSGNSNSWKVLIGRRFTNSTSHSEGLTQASELLFEGLHNLPSTAMFEYASEFYREHVILKDDFNKNSVDDNIIPNILKIYTNSQEMMVESKLLRSHYIHLLLQLGHTQEAYTQSVNGVVIFPASGDIWIYLLELSQKKGLNTSEIQTLFNKGMAAASDDRAIIVWLHALQFIFKISKVNQVSTEEEIKHVIDYFKKAMRSNIVNVGSLCDLSLQWGMNAGGIPLFRKVVDVVLAVPRELMTLNDEFFHNVLLIETTCEKSVLNSKRVRKIFEAALQATSGQSVDMWVQYIQFERQERQFKQANALQWRARKQISNEIDLNTFDTNVNICL